MLPRRLLLPVLLPTPVMVAIEINEEEGGPEAQEEDEEEEEEEDIEEEGLPFFTGDWKASKKTCKPP